jgi:protein SCO1/2
MNKRLLWLILIANVIVAPALFFTAQRLVNKKRVVYANPGAESALADYGRVTEFALVEKSGSKITLDDLKGGPWVANFMFTNCQGQCPVMSLQMSGLQNSLPAGMKLVSFSVDPDKDSPEVLLNYAKRYNAESGRWLFLTGSKDTVNGVLTSFHFNKVDNPNSHSVRFALVDSQGRIRGYYNSLDESALKKLVGDARLLVSEEGELNGAER